MQRSRRLPLPHLRLALTPLSLLPMAAAGDLLLADFENGLAAARVTAQHATVAAVQHGANHALAINTPAEVDWPGITISGPPGGWDLSACARVTLTVKNTGTSKVSVSCRVDNDGADGTSHCVTGSVDLAPGKSGTLPVNLRRCGYATLDGKLFGLRGYPVAGGGTGTIDPARVTRLLVFVGKPKTPHSFEIDDIRAEGRYTAPTASVTDTDPYFPFIDTFGQYRHRPWPGKTLSVENLRQRRAAEAKTLAADPGPEHWNQWGGWENGPKLNPTGFFRTEKYQGKWWLVDPDGRLFWSHGIDCVRMTDATPIAERETWFEDPPWEQPELAQFVVPAGHALKGHYAGRPVKCYSFASANLLRKYGADWKRELPLTVHRRLRAWGLNTIAMWSDEDTRLLRKTPYVDAVGSHGTRLIEGSEGYWGKFPDVFDPSFREVLTKGARSRVGRSAGDPWCLGYFSDNEMSWGDPLSLGQATLKSPPDQPAKQVFIADLKEKYQSIKALNDAWGTHHASWEALAAHREVPPQQAAQTDLEAFYAKAADSYFREVRTALRAVAPHQLYLGCRFAWTNPLAAVAAAKHCDVVSYNLYQHDVADFKFDGGADVPLIIGEFHFGALDRGLFHTGLVPVMTQAERAQAYRDYVRGALRHPQFVGCHWFQYQDEPTTGRIHDEENYQIGFVDIADTPYPETVAASRAVANGLYELRLKTPVPGKD